MSAGEFTSTFYELDTGNGSGVARVKVQPETLLATINSVANASPGGPATLPVSAKVSKGNREIGIGTRTVTLRFTSGAPTDYSGDDVVIPVLQESTFAAWSIGQTGTYLSTAVEVVGRSPESVR